MIISKKIHLVYYNYLGRKTPHRNIEKLRTEMSKNSAQGLHNIHKCRKIKP